MKWANQTDTQRMIGDPYENLANAIVIQAARDYVDAEDGWHLNSLRRFFRSDQYKQLTEVDPEWLINTLDLKRKAKQKSQRRLKR